MSRSRRRTPITGITTADSEKQDKRHANRVLRRKVKQGAFGLRLKDVSNAWMFAKDGKQYLGSAQPDLMRK